MSSSESRAPKVLLGVLEPSLALLGAVALTLLLTVSALKLANLLNPSHQLEVQLRPEAGASPLSHEEIEQGVDSLGVAEDARVLLDRGSSRLVLEGVDDPESATRAVEAFLTRSGYQRDDFVRTEVFDPEDLLRGDANSIPIMIAIQAVIFALGGYAMVWTRGLAWEGSTPTGRWLPRTVASWPRVAALGVAAGLGAVVMSAVLAVALTLVGLPVEEQPWLKTLFGDPATLLRISPWIVLVGPISEEIFFRFYVFRFMVAHAGYPTGLVVSSLLFALVHGNISGLLVYLGIGCVLAWAYHRTGRLAAPIIAHVTLNAIVLVTSTLTGSFDG